MLTLQEECMQRCKYLSEMVKKQKQKEEEEQNQANGDMNTENQEENT